ncbi:MAG: transglutaminase family protein [Gammaproteobacteria bacterium]
MRRIQIKHITRYDYPQPVRLLTHKLLIRPREGHDIRIESSQLSITPNYSIQWQRDIYGNSVALVDFTIEARSLNIASNVIVQHYEEQPLKFLIAESANHYPFHYDSMEQADLIPYQLAAFPQDYPIVRKWLEPICETGKIVKTAALLDALNNKIAQELKYQIREEPGVQTPGQTINLLKGSCRDFATLFIESCRTLGFASRFVSGYLLQNEGSNQHQSTHAWSEVYLPGAGWRGFDSTSGNRVGGNHIAVAHHRHPEAIPPVSGAFLGPMQTGERMVVEVQVNRL